MKLKITYLLSLIIVINIIAVTKIEARTPVLIGYFHNWNTAKAPYIPLELVDKRYNLIAAAFAIPKSGTTYNMKFIPSQVSKTEFIRQIKLLQQQGRKVLISIGGGGTIVKLNSTGERDTFIKSMSDIIRTYGFDGIDIDLESSSVTITGGTIKHPVDSTIIYMIDAIKEIMTEYRNIFGRKLLLTMAPETAYVQGGQSRYGGVWGAYLPIIDALRDSIDILQTQLYNSGSMYGIDRNIYIQETADFIIAMCEAVIQGFDTQGGHFDGLPSNKIAVGLPACPKAAGGGYTLPSHVRKAINYLLGNGVQPGLYKLYKEQGYPDLAGMMTWSINWDAVNSCGGSYEYADIFEDIFKTTDITERNDKRINVSPNPAADYIVITMSNYALKGMVEVYNVLGICVIEAECHSRESRNLRIDVSRLSEGVYFVRIGGQILTFVKT